MDFIEVVKLVEQYVATVKDPDTASDDLSEYRHYIFEAAVEAVKGKAIWNELNPILEKI